jgi:hypothetical protein
MTDSLNAIPVTPWDTNDHGQSFGPSRHDRLSPRRCRQLRRSDGGACQQPAMPNGCCRLHGGKITGPRTAEGLEWSRKARLTHGYYTAAAKAERQESRAQLRALKMLLREPRA